MAPSGVEEKARLSGGLGFRVYFFVNRRMDGADFFDTTGRRRVVRVKRRMHQRGVLAKPSSPLTSD